MPSLTLLLIALAGFAGAVARYWLGQTIARRWPTPFPYGTLVINVTGALALGLLTGLGLAGRIPDLLRVPLAVGLLGAYTTFSTWMLETVRLDGTGNRHLALLNLAAAAAAGVPAAWAGLWLGARL